MASIYERNGKFCVVYNYTNTNGERKQKWETYDTRAEARRRKKEIEYKLNAGALVIPQCKYMKDLLREYVDLYGKDKWALSTYRGNVAIIDHYILPLIGDVKLENVNTPKVKWDKTTRVAEMFSRKVIACADGSHYRHIGIYAYRADVLAKITQLPQSPLEIAERLEQLRWLENGYMIRVGVTEMQTIGIDTPDDLAKAIEWYKHS